MLEDEADLAIARIALGHVLAREPDRAAIGELEPGDDPQQRGLARAGRPEQRAQNSPCPQIEADVVERL